MKYLFIFTALFFFSDMALSQYQTDDNWVTRYLDDGGDLDDVTGLKAEIPSFQKFHRVAVPQSMPSYWDWNDVLGATQPIRNQGSCGSCWSFSVVASLESVLALHGLGFFNNLSEETLVSPCSNSGSCNGGYFTALDYIKKNGLPWEDQNPYTARNSRRCKETENVYKIHDWFYIGQGGRSPSVDEIKTAILKYGPVSVDVNASFGNYSSGIYDNCRYGGTNHMVNIEGWSDDGEYWIMRNSWGKNWGEEGRMRIKWKDSRGRRCNNIGNVVAAILLYPEDRGGGSLAESYGVNLN